MSSRKLLTAEDFRQYRSKLGFSNQTAAKAFFAAKDITPTVDYAYIDILNQRLEAIVRTLNEVMAPELRCQTIGAFIQENIVEPLKIMKQHNILPRLNNQGRRPESVYFSWMRGFVLSNLFLPALGKIFGVDTTQIDLIGDDDLKSIETFKRTPKADLEVRLPNGSPLRIEMQTGFTGINDVKQHKVIEAKRHLAETGHHTLALHFDVYNGQVAFVQLDSIAEDSINWITRQQMEGQTVFNIDQNYFVWGLTEMPPQYHEIVTLGS